MYDVLNTEAARRALALHDIATVYRLLNEAGVQQRQIAKLTGQKQSEVSDIILGRRQVLGYDTLVKIADGLDIPRGWMGLAYHEDGEVRPEVAEEDEETCVACSWRSGVI